MKNIAQVVASRIRAVRMAAGLTQTTLAARTGIQRPIISRLESGKHTPTLETLDRVAAALGVSLAALVERAAAGGPLSSVAEVR